MSQPPSIPGVTASSVDGELLWGFWYPALRDVCPRCAFPLSAERYDGQTGGSPTQQVEERFQ
jgi:hypothetical protein